MAAITPEDKRTRLLIRVATAWHVLLVPGLLIGVVLVWQASLEQGFLRWIAIVLFSLGALASAAAVPLMMRRDYRGRMLSLAVNYLGFLVCLVGALQVLGVFLAIDALADTFGRGLLPLLGVFAGYLVGAWGDRYADYPQRQQLFQRIGKVAMAIFGALFLVVVGLFNGLLALLTNLANSPTSIVLVVGSLLFGVIIWAVWREPTARAFRTTSSHAEIIDGYLFLSPNLLGFLIFFAGPLLLSFYISFTNWDAFGNQRDWIGLENYRRVFTLDVKQMASADQSPTEVLDVTRFDELSRFSVLGKHVIVGAEDKRFWIAIRNTLVFCFLAVPLSVVPALFLANVLNSKVPGMQFFRAVYFLPSVAATVGVAIIWQWLYNSSIGYVNYGITSLIDTLNGVLGTAIVDPKLRWTSDSSTALISVVIMAAWQTMGFNTVLFLAGLQNIPGELYEAATVDGAGRWARFRNVTLPLLAPTTFYVVTTTSIQAMQVFEQIYILINPPEGPNNATLSMVLHLYLEGFKNFKQGYASAVAWILFFVIFIITLIQFRRQGAGNE